ncbi:unnamed protein product [Adineta steineri]|uniref:Uncharacterized protein n=1 Tax=Adineta steineri TaxID=433720 RepID=A0A819K2I3_9BILA|nr:unnamed protein product [Adineta steineri]CAF3942164.1 unnamed protein product [Adineta steineri]
MDLFRQKVFNSGLSDTQTVILYSPNNGVVVTLSTESAYGPFTFLTRDPLISRGISIIDPKKKLVNGTESDRDAEFVLSSSTGLMDPDFIRSDVDILSPLMYHIYWGSQTTHAGGRAYLNQFIFLFQHYQQI